MHVYSVFVESHLGIIERFFLMIKAEIEREIRRCERKRQAKRQQRRRKKREPDDNLLERAWLNTFDSSDAGGFSVTPSAATLHSPISPFSSPSFSAHNQNWSSKFLSFHGSGYATHTLQ